MRITVDAQALADTLSKCVAPRNHANQAVQHALMRIVEGELQISTTDLVTTMVSHLACTTEGDQIVDGGYMPRVDMLRHALFGLEGDVVLDEGESFLFAGRRRFPLDHWDPNLFPVADKMAFKTLDCDPLELKQGLQSVKYAADKDNIEKPWANGVYLGGGYAVATNSFRMATQAIDSLKLEDGVIVPSQTVQRVIDALNEDSQVHLLKHPGSKIFQALKVVNPNGELRTQLLGTAYPTWTNAAAEQETLDWHVQFSIKEARPVLNRLMKFVEMKTGKYTVYKCRVSGGDNELRFDPMITTNKGVHEFIPCHHEGEIPDFGMNADNINDVLTQMNDKGDVLTWHGSPKSVQVFTSESSNCTHYVMPLRD